MVYMIYFHPLINRKIFDFVIFSLIWIQYTLIRLYILITVSSKWILEKKYNSDISVYHKSVELKIKKKEMDDWFCTAEWSWLTESILYFFQIAVIITIQYEHL